MGEIIKDSGNLKLEISSLMESGAVLLQSESWEVVGKE